MRLRSFSQTAQLSRMSQSSSARDCYKPCELPMVLKWFSETTGTRYVDLYPGQLQSFQTCFGTPMAGYLTAVRRAGNAFKIQNSREWKLIVSYRSLWETLCLWGVLKKTVQLLVIAGTFSRAGISGVMIFILAISAIIRARTSGCWWILKANILTFPMLKTSE